MFQIPNDFNVVRGFLCYFVTFRFRAISYVIVYDDRSPAYSETWYKPYV